MQIKTAPCQRIERSASTPVARQKTPGLARGRSSHFGPLDDGDFYTSAAQKQCRTGPDHAAAANHDPHHSSRAWKPITREALLRLLRRIPSLAGK